jgi:hypothetical protein
MSAGAPPPIFIFEAGSVHNDDRDIQNDYQAMRYELTVTLSQDGYFVYDEVLNPTHPFRHASSWWYDEYDNAGDRTGYLGQPAGPATEPIPGVLRRDFTNGVSFANTSAVTATVELEKPFRKILGIQDSNYNDGALVQSFALGPHDGRILLNPEYKRRPYSLLLPAPYGQMLPR